jgi:uncharacterized protein
LRGALIVFGILAALGALTAAALTFGGELGAFMLASLEALPFLVLAVLAQAGERRVWARVLTYGWLVLLVLGFAIFVATIALSAEIVATSGSTVPSNVGGVMLAVVAAFLLAFPTLFRPVRVAIARLIPISPDSLVHKVALFYLIYLTIASFGQLAALGGQPALLAAAGSVETTRSSTGQILDLFYGLAWILPMALVGAGYPLRRALGEAIRRLGFTRPTRNQVLVGLGLAVVLVGVFTGVDDGLAWIWGQMGWAVTDTTAFNKLIGAGFSPIGALAIGITAGIGEEAATRGLLQPRLGKLLPNLAFVSVHAFQYGADGLISVFLMGLILAFVRSRSSTTIAALVHGSYDFVVIMLSVLGF